MLWVHGAWDDVVVGCLGESESLGLEGESDRHGLGLGLESGELDSTEASGLPLLVLGGDFEGEDGVTAELGFEEVTEVVGSDCLWKV